MSNYFLKFSSLVNTPLSGCLDTTLYAVLHGKPLTNKLHNCGITDFKTKLSEQQIYDSQEAKKNYDKQFDIWK